MTSSAKSVCRFALWCSGCVKLGENGIGVGLVVRQALLLHTLWVLPRLTLLRMASCLGRFCLTRRSEMPDIDLDFDDERRLEVVEHVVRFMDLSVFLMLYVLDHQGKLSNK